MGLLDDLLGQIAGDGRTATPERQRPAPAAAPAGGAMGPLLTALLPVVLSMLAGSGRGQGRSASAGGGLGDILGQVLGGSGAGGGAGGGLGALLEQFQRAGFGEQAGSWVGTGANQPLPDDALARVFGRNGIAEIARRAGVSEQDAERGLAAVLPEVVDRMTPDGQMPPQDRLLASVDDLTRRLGV
jgi:uncharacterized protein YidB (DUF937 family)